MLKEILGTSPTKASTISTSDPLPAWLIDTENQIQSIYEVLAVKGALAIDDYQSFRLSHHICEALSPSILEYSTSCLHNPVHSDTVLNILLSILGELLACPAHIEVPDTTEYHMSDLGVDYYVEPEPFDWSEALEFHENILKVREWRFRRDTPR